MRIAFDALPLVSNRMTGIGYCEAGQIQAMMMLHPEEQYVLQFFDKGDGVEKRKRLYYYEQQRNVSVQQGHFSGYFYRLLTTAIPLPYRAFFGKDAEITHFFNYIIPPGVSGKRIVTVHDMVYKTFPETVRRRTRFMLETGLQRSLHRADLIVTDSAFSKSEIIRYFPATEGEDSGRALRCGQTSFFSHASRSCSSDGRIETADGLTGKLFSLSRDIRAEKEFRPADSCLCTPETAASRCTATGLSRWLWLAKQ